MRRGQPVPALRNPKARSTACRRRASLACALQPRGRMRISCRRMRVSRLRRGATTFEYLVLLGMVAMLGVGGLRRFGGSVDGVANRQSERVRTLSPGSGNVLPGDGARLCDGVSTCESSAPQEPTLGGLYGMVASLVLGQAP